LPNATSQRNARRVSLASADRLLADLRWPPGRPGPAPADRIPLAAARTSRLHLGPAAVQALPGPVRGEEVVLLGEPFYRIANYDRMRPFFMTVVSAFDHWMFISSTGALTAGRRDPDLALFPYCTDDKIHDSADITGSKTLIVASRQGRDCLWEPFSERYRGIYRLQRNLYKSLCGSRLVFEEANFDLDLVFRYGWFSGDRFGFVRRAWLTNCGLANVRVRLLDGLQNLMPCGAGSQFQLEKSSLLDAYKKNELVSGTGLGLFRLSSIPIDRPEPAESLRTTVAWSLGLEECRRLLSSVQVDAFRRGEPVSPETDVRAERGAYLLEGELPLARGATREWMIVADVNQGPCEVAGLNRLLGRPSHLWKLVEKDIHAGTRELERIVASADGLQASARSMGNARHFSNVLFNVMRGGVFYHGYDVDVADLQAFVRNANRDLAARRRAFFRRLMPRVRQDRLIRLAARGDDRDLERLCREYLPLTFSRRHGDPSRPWNRFRIAARNPDGSRALEYEGNWRDIFQNWEALALSFPAYAAGMVCRFANASTVDGYNPYRITREGIDWEVVDPANPWSHIGYWGDHQIIYLLKLLELLQRHEPATLRGFLTRNLFSYANVPYRIRPYEQLVRDPRNTIVFDGACEELVRQRVAARGSDGKLLWDEQGRVRLVNLAEKLLVALLAKLSNFVPDAGIWLNTQRPEWNDANNALVGNGVSMVTLCYIRRFLAFCLEILQPLEGADIELSEEVAAHLEATGRILRRHRALLGTGLDERQRRRVLDELGRAGGRYRRAVYARGLSGRTARVGGAAIRGFLETALAFVDGSIRSNRRSDGLYHAYNLINLETPGELHVHRLYEMLEGQVAVLSSGRLTPEASLEVLQALRRSSMYRADQNTYLLYPDRQLPRFLEMNNIPRRDVEASRLLRRLLRDNNRSLVERDVNGRVHFNARVMNAPDVSRILAELAAAGYGRLVRSEAQLLLDLFERLTGHASFTGRSGTFFGYEGLGCIYWHMVSKLLLAAQESFFRAADAGAPADLLQQLADCYYDIRAGLGDHKTPDVYGAFPADPYSHTPGHAGARQPGLTGQVKEDILCRWGELGVFVDGGQIRFTPLLLRRDEFQAASRLFTYVDVRGTRQRLRIPANSLAFTYCQVPIVYEVAGECGLEVVFQDGTRAQSRASRLSAEISRSIFDRSGRVRMIRAAIVPNNTSRGNDLIP
jgi:hypothetical protein